MTSTSSDPASPPLARLQGITRRFPGVLANDRIDLSLCAGRIHALLGENGAGKSTLVKILYGLLQADAGQLHWQGRPCQIDSPAAARLLGIAMVFQHFSLFDSLSVQENIALGIDAPSTPALALRIVEVSNRYGLPLDPSRDVYSLSVGERQRIEIVRCLLQAPRLLIMDEPTSVLTPQEAEGLFDTLRRLASEGMAILYISHKLDEIRALCDEATILRAGRSVAQVDPRVESAQSLAARMMGGELRKVRRGDQADTLGAPARLQVQALQGPAVPGAGLSLHDIELHVCAGEIVGIAGVAGNGQDELLEYLTGERLTVEPDMIQVDGQPMGCAGPAVRRRAGLCCVPEQRLGHATVPEFSLAENALLTGHARRDLLRAGLVSMVRARRFAREVIERFDVRCHGVNSAAMSLSGGNLQKFVVGREILQAPAVLVLAQPTWGVDAGAAAVIHQALQGLAASGVAVLVISQDLDELMLICDRLHAICAGRLSPVYPVSKLSIEDVGLLMGGAPALSGPTLSDSVLSGSVLSGSVPPADLSQGACP